MHLSAVAITGEAQLGHVLLAQLSNGSLETFNMTAARYLHEAVMSIKLRDRIFPQLRSSNQKESSQQENILEISDSVPTIDLPPCEIGKLEEISELVSSCLPSPVRREKLASAIENEGYIKKLLNLFQMCEDLEKTEGLHHLYEIFKNIFLLNKNALF
jgi:hypothetical protein